VTGFVSIVGAGPGDPDLLTVKAARRLADADLVLYDALVSGESLRLATRAHCFFVGKRAGLPSIRQEAIHRILIAAARAGRRVVRLKAGDPFVFGRGGEEALALACADVPYEVVPGVSSAIAAPALAGIPVTHRGFASGFAVLSGHDPAAWGPMVDAIPPESMTLVVLMGLGSRAPIAERLLQRGWPRATPAAVLLASSTPNSASWVGTLSELGTATLPDAGRAPGTLVVGRVASLASAIGSSARADLAFLSDDDAPARASGA
jgi:uroporphyrin-III C-methyltransferase/precorrin-2 dehydrogenase/sirohydrochlorin ferrochelatase